MNFAATNLLGSGFMQVAAVLVAAMAVYMLLAFTGVIRKGQSVFQIGSVFAFALELPVLYVLKPVRWALWKIPGVAAGFAWAQSQLTDDAIERFFDWCFRPSKSHLMRGELEAHAAQRWPAERWPHLWRNDIPEDLRRPLVVDGRLVDGSYPGDELAPAFVDKVLVGQAFRRAVLCGVFWFVAALLLWHPHSYLAPAANNIAGELPMQRADAGAGLQSGVASVREDIWSLNALSDKIQSEAKLQAEVEKARRDAIISSAPGGFVTAVLFGLLVFFGTWRGLVRDAAQAKIEPLRRQQKEAVVRWKYRLDQREMEYKAYLGQLKTLEWDKTPLIEIGTASGVFRFRGHVSAPTQKQAMRYSLQDMAQHTLVLGGTGEGKTRSMILPVVRQLLALRKQLAAAGKPRAVSFYATDGKAVLWRDIQAEAIKAGQGDAVRIIGCDREAGQFGVDLLEGVSPQVVSDIIRSVMRQAKGGGEGGDSFWPDMASEVIRCAAVLARAWEVTDDGLALIGTTGERIYSLVTVYQLATSIELQERAVRAVLAAVDDPAQWPYVAEFATPELFDAIRYMRGQWLTMANDTRTGIIANVTNAMAAFASNADLRNAFANGSGRNLLKMADAWGAICLVNVSSLEYGVAGRIINVMLKTLLYIQARKREMADPQIGFNEKLLFTADEFQDLVTADVAGVSDANFWNVARSTGVIGFISTQGMASLEQAIGKTAAENFALQMRNKIFLRVEDPATMELAKKLAGKSLRSYTFANGRYESYDAMVRETGADPLDDGPARIVELPDNYLGALARGWLQAHKASLPITFDTFKSAYDVDLRFVPRGGLGQSSSEESILSAQQAAHWRQEDKSLAYMTEGNHQADVLQDEDLISMGRSHAYVYLQRAGATRQDIAEIA
ncbi:type IV secretion system DNA-binding domain-containing protein [Ralstonia solanacearum]|uniref:type IV secretory system conjugative DNA transfer family protein n=1 Tax=Ralstonia solanacearum TaxID=305 RepID=UPI001FF89EBB|nr:TraM recognition domain-containing protein [Ralstonia solanacearum]MDC6237007.1 type IV secretion system DNA-binding domain-containing protein [Ralstonia solanacearum]MDD7810560.1 type IV secretion system DNA-binding domain-containing protein [Ralstonia solanacearum]